MAGSIGHITDDNGDLLPYDEWLLDNAGDYIECIQDLWDQLQAKQDIIDQLSEGRNP